MVISPNLAPMASTTSASTRVRRTAGGMPTPASPTYRSSLLSNRSCRRKVATTGRSYRMARSRNAARPPVVHPPPPISRTGLSAAARTARTASTSSAEGARSTASTRDPGRADTTSRSMSSGSDTTTGPGRSDMATVNAVSTTLGRSSASSTSTTHLARSSKNDVYSISWNASRPRWDRPTWPTNRIMGVEHWSAVCTPMEALVAPGPRVTKQIPGRPVSRPHASAM